MVCTSCGAEANASCNCGVDYKPKAVRAREAVEANPEKSDRAIAKEIRVTAPTVGKARRESTVNDFTVDERTGLDGKTRKQPTTFPAAMRTRAKRLGYRIRRMRGVPGEEYRLQGGPLGLSTPRFFDVAGLQWQLDIIEGKTAVPPGWPNHFTQAAATEQAPVETAPTDEQTAPETAEHNRAALVIYAGTAIDLAEKVTSFADLENVTDEAKETIHRAAAAWAELDAKGGTDLAIDISTDVPVSATMQTDAELTGAAPEDDPCSEEAERRMREQYTRDMRMSASRALSGAKATAKLLKCHHCRNLKDAELAASAQAAAAAWAKILVATQPGGGEVNK
jgi:hypothetical protein